MKTLFALVTLLSVPLAACKKSEPAADPKPGSASPAAGDGCDASAARIADLTMGSEKGSGSDAATVARVVTGMKATLSAHCRDDKWPAAFVSCTGAAGTGEQLSACMKGPSKLSKDQTDKLAMAMATVVEKEAPGATKQYYDKARAAEAALQLNRLGKNAKTYFITSAEYPKGEAAELPEQPCCSAPDHKCPVSTAWATDKVWSALDFTVEEPTRFQYTYHSDGATFTATAVGDLDCDGKAITYTLTGSAANGNPETKLVEP